MVEKPDFGDKIGFVTERPIIQLQFEAFSRMPTCAGKFYHALGERVLELYLDGWRDVNVSVISAEAKKRHYHPETLQQLSQGHGITLTAYCGCQTIADLDGQPHFQVKRCGDEECKGLPREADVAHNKERHEHR